MGWSFSMDKSHDRKACIAELVNGFSCGWKPLKHRAVGNHLWILLEGPDKSKSIYLFLLQGGKDMGWGYKGMGEEMCPYYYDCPLSLLNEASTPLNAETEAWRQKVRDHHAKKAAKVAPRPGLEVVSGKHTYTLVEKLAPRRGWRVQQQPSGIFYRMPAAQLSRALQA